MCSFSCLHFVFQVLIHALAVLLEAMHSELVTRRVHLATPAFSQTQLDNPNAVCYCRCLLLLCVSLLCCVVQRCAQLVLTVPNKARSARSALLVCLFSLCPSLALSLSPSHTLTSHNRHIYWRSWPPTLHRLQSWCVCLSLCVSLRVLNVCCTQKQASTPPRLAPVCVCSVHRAKSAPLAQAIAPIAPWEATLTAPERLTGAFSCVCVFSVAFSLSVWICLCVFCAHVVFVCRSNICPVGKFSNQPGSPQCTPCPIGQSQSNVNSTSCDPCPVSYSTPSTGSIFCAPCDAGR